MLQVSELMLKTQSCVAQRHSAEKQWRETWEFVDNGVKANQHRNIRRLQLLLVKLIKGTFEWLLGEKTDDGIRATRLIFYGKETEVLDNRSAGIKLGSFALAFDFDFEWRKGKEKKTLLWPIMIAHMITNHYELN